MSILRKPLVTEKVTALNEEGIYGFIVDKRANKIEICKAIQKLYNVSTPERINTMVYAGKKTTKYTKKSMVKGARPAFKKAIVKLKPGEVIDFYGDI